MKTFITLCLATLFLSSLHAQPVNKYLVRFTNKKNSPYSFNNPLQYLSQKAIDRRNKYGIALDSSDLPVNPSYVQQVVAQGAVTYLDQSKWLNQILVTTTDQNALNNIRKLSFVDTVMQMYFSSQPSPQPDKFSLENRKPITVTHFQPVNNDTFNYGQSFGQINIHDGQYLHQKGFAGEGMTITFLDAGFYHYQTVKDLDSARVHHQILGVKDFVAFDNSVNEDDSHGEETLSTIAANLPGQMVGSAPHASFWLIRTEDVNSEYPIEEHNWVVGAEFADSVGTDLITSSLTYTQFDEAQFDHTYNDFYKNTTMISKGATRAAQKGILVTVSAGNYGDEDWKYIGFPADDDSVCAVGATDVNGHIASFSSFGYPGKVKPNVCSVGEGTVIYSPTGGVTFGDGTSFSNPNMNGLIACLWQAFPQFNNMTILNALYSSSNKYAHPNNRFGFGIPNMKKAYKTLKKMQNAAQYGNDWLFASRREDGNIAVKLISQQDGNGRLDLKDASGRIISSIPVTTEDQEVYDYSFNLSVQQSPENLSVQYSDENSSRTINLNRNGKQQAASLQVIPSLFHDEINVSLQAPESNQATIRLIDASGKIMEQRNLSVNANQSYNLSLNNLQSLSDGLYILEYTDASFHKTVKLVKQ